MSHKCHCTIKSNIGFGIRDGALVAYRSVRRYRQLFLYDAVAFPTTPALAAFRAAIAAFLISVKRNCISITKYVTIEVTV